MAPLKKEYLMNPNARDALKRSMARKSMGAF